MPGYSSPSTTSKSCASRPANAGPASWWVISTPQPGVTLGEPGEHLGHQGEQHRLERRDAQRAAHLGQRGAQLRLGLLEPLEDRLGVRDQDPRLGGEPHAASRPARAALTPVSASSWLSCCDTADGLYDRARATAARVPRRSSSRSSRRRCTSSMAASLFPGPAQTVTVQFFLPLLLENIRWTKRSLIGEAGGMHDEQAAPMTTTAPRPFAATAAPAAAPRQRPPEAARPAGRAALLVLGSCTSLQAGAALAMRLFPVTGAPGATLLRLALAAAVLLGVARPRVRGWRPCAVARRGALRGQPRGHERVLLRRARPAPARDRGDHPVPRAAHPRGRALPALARRRLGAARRGRAC